MKHNFNKIYINYCGIACHFKIFSAKAFTRQLVPEELTLHSKVSKSIACVTLICKAAYEIKSTFF